VRVETPNPLFASTLQQRSAASKEIRVLMQYLFQACGARGDPKFRDLLMIPLQKNSAKSTARDSGRAQSERNSCHDEG
jgi:hypothetical protein